MQMTSQLSFLLGDIVELWRSQLGYFGVGKVTWRKPLGRNAKFGRRTTLFWGRVHDSVTGANTRAKPLALGSQTVQSNKQTAFVGTTSARKVTSKACT